MNFFGRFWLIVITTLYMYLYTLQPHEVLNWKLVVQWGVPFVKPIKWARITNGAWIGEGDLFDGVCMAKKVCHSKMVSDIKFKLNWWVGEYLLWSSVLMMYDITGQKGKPHFW